MLFRSASSPPNLGAAVGSWDRTSSLGSGRFALDLGTAVGSWNMAPSPLNLGAAVGSWDRTSSLGSGRFARDLETAVRSWDVAFSPLNLGAAVGRLTVLLHIFSMLLCLYIAKVLTSSLVSEKPWL